ncbi:MAG: polymer-forming cytoskeletal protein [Anaerolineales bacterium]|nr:polymer-forming cytoskeletal protein [Anaerolineales bacterium]MCS7246626.1 polymer-forming cytoskeletal protein [Anaerolineales bacterium]MDW8160436.1 polymer-forming cytoskeletal protein [Anaerolineales bacterium]MDW8447781.1 polymer-forming cytoskeletal protein [Anaerolineales bacterium]
MRRILLVAVLTALLAALLIPWRVLAGEATESKVVFGGEFTLHKNEVLNGDLVVFGGTAELQEGSRITGNVAFFGGNLSCQGEIAGDIVGFGGEISLQRTAQVGGDVILFGSAYQQEEGARITGKVLQFESFRPFAAVYPFRVELPNLDWIVQGWMRWGSFLFRVFAWSALAVLVGLLFPQPLERIANAVRDQGIVATAVGLVSAIIVLASVIFLAVTLVFLPVSLLGLIAAALGWLLGVLGIGLETGRRIAEGLGQSWSSPIAAGVGTFVLVFVVNGVSALIPCIGWTIPLAVGLVGFGAVVLTQFGLKEVVL